MRYFLILQVYALHRFFEISHIIVRNGLVLTPDAICPSIIYLYYFFQY